MSSESFRDLINARPFQAFTIHFPDGNALTVQNQDAVHLAPGGRMGVVFTGGDKIRIVDVFSIIYVTTIDPAIPAEMA